MKQDKFKKTWLIWTRNRKTLQKTSTKGGEKTDVQNMKTCSTYFLYFQATYFVHPHDKTTVFSIFCQQIIIAALRSKFKPVGITKSPSHENKQQKTSYCTVMENGDNRNRETINSKEIKE